MLSNAAKVFSNPSLLGTIIKELGPSDQPRLLATSKAQFTPPLIIEALSTLSIEEQRNFFSNPKLNFFHQRIEKGMADTKLPVHQQLQNNIRLARSASLEKSKPFIRQAIALLDKEVNYAQLAVPSFENHGSLASTAEVCNVLENLIDILIQEDNSAPLHSPELHEALLSHIRKYFEVNSKLDNARLVEYAIRVAATKPCSFLNRSQKAKDLQDLMDLISSKEKTFKVTESVIEWYSRVLRDEEDGMDNQVLKKEIVERINVILEKDEVKLSPEIKKQTLFNLMYALNEEKRVVAVRVLTWRLSVEGSQEPKVFLYQELQKPIKTLISQVEENLSPEERGEIIRNFLRAMPELRFGENLKVDCILDLIALFSQNEISAGATEDALKDLGTLFLRGSDSQRTRILDIFDQLTQRPISVYEKKMISIYFAGAKHFRKITTPMQERMDAIQQR